MFRKAMRSTRKILQAMIAQYEKKLPVPSKLKTEDIIAETFSDFDLNKTEECQDKVTSKTSEKRFSFIFFFEILNPNRKLHFCFSQTLLFRFFFFLSSDLPLMRRKELKKTRMIQAF